MAVRTTDPQVHAQRTDGGPILAAQYRAAIRQQRGHLCWPATRLNEYSTCIRVLYILVYVLIHCSAYN